MLNLAKYYSVRDVNTKSLYAQKGVEVSYTLKKLLISAVNYGQ
jgi:hypothetical protein